MKTDRKLTKRWLMLAAVVLIIGLVKAGTKTVPDLRPDEVHILISLSGDNGYKAYYEELIERFNRSVLDMRLIPYYAESDSHAILKLLYSKQANLTYDIACLGAPQITTLTDMELIQPLDQYVLRDLGIGWVNSTSPVKMTNATKNGNIYSLPLFYTNNVLYLNEELISWTGEDITTARMLKLAEDYHTQCGQPGLILAADKLLIDLLTAGEPGIVVPASEREKTLNITGESKQQLVDHTRRLLRDGSCMNLKANGIRNIEAFIDGRVPLLAGSSYYANQIRTAAEFTAGVRMLKVDDQTDYPMNGNNLYLVNHSDSGEPAWRAIIRLMELTEEQVPASYRSNNFSRMAVHQNSKILHMMEMAVLRMWQEDTETEEIINQLQIQINEVLQEGE